jgi:hypothetical protein
MKTLAVTYEDTNEPMRPEIEEWIPEDALESVRADLRAHGFRIVSIRTVSWQAQLARAENPEF